MRKNNGEKHVLGFDIGGSGVRGILTENRRLIKKDKVFFSDKAKKEPEALLEELFGFVRRLAGGLDKKSIAGIGIGCPSPLSQDKKIILNSPNLKSLAGLRLAEECEKATGIKTKLENDARLFALAEAVLGAGKGCEIVLGVTLGTGVGGGIIFNGKIYEGASNCASEIGHLTIDYNGRQCSCGRKGCLEEYVSARGIRRLSREIIGEEFSPKDIREMAKDKNPEALRIFREAGVFLGTGLANITTVLNPDIIIVGGGVGAAWEFMKDSCFKIIGSQVICDGAKKTKIVPAKMGDFAGAAGAGLLWQ